jgi:hypothetical protein
MPVVLAGRKPDYIAGPDLLDRSAFAASPGAPARAFAFGVARQSVEFVVAPAVAENDCHVQLTAKIVPSFPPINPEPKMPIRRSISLSFHLAA